MGRLKILIKHVLILILFDLMYLGFVVNSYPEKSVIIFFVTLPLLGFLLPASKLKYMQPVILLQKIILIICFSRSSFDVTYVIKLVLWSGLVALYLYLFFTELKESYFNPHFSRYDLSPPVDIIFGEFNNNGSFYLSNISENGFFCRIDKMDHLLKGEVSGHISVANEKYEFLGQVISLNQYGCGVKVVLNNNWYKLYQRVLKLNYLGNE